MRRTKHVVLAKSLQSNCWRESDAMAVLSSWRESGLSLRVYARRHGLSLSRLVRWKVRLGAGSGTVGFHRVEVAQPPALPPAGTGVEVCCSAAKGCACGAVSILRCWRRWLVRSSRGHADAAVVGADLHGLRTYGLAPRLRRIVGRDASHHSCGSTFMCRA